MTGRVFRVMLSSTFRDLIDHRQAVRDAILGQVMLPLIMETDTANPSRGIITSSLAMVDDADAYVVLISNYRYGQVIADPELNPDELSVTELEFRHAEKRGLPLCIFLMDEDAPVSPMEVLKEAKFAEKLASFRTRAQHPSRIIATFSGVEELRRKVTQTLARLKTELENPGVTPTRAPEPGALPKPPLFHAKPPYTPGHAFEGRAQELTTLGTWARSADPVMVVEAIGGMGKSMLTWQWVNHRAGGLGVDWAGRLWYSFYERGADMRDFKVTALAYLTGQAPETIVLRPEAEVTDDLLTRLRGKPWLLVLDGLERVLAAYHRSDAAQVRDDDIEGDTGLKDRKPTDCIRPADDDLLRRLPAEGPSKLLISSRLMPRVFCPFGANVPGVAHVPLRGLTPEDAEAMLRRAGIKGDSARMRRYLDGAFAGHPLLVGFAAGLIRHAPWAGMSFDRWEDDARGGAAVNLADPSITNRRENILKLAFDALEPNARELLARMGMLANAVGLDVLEALNPARPDSPKEVREPVPPDENRDFRLDMLRRQLSAATGEKDRADLERRIAERRRERQGEYETACAAHAAYQTALAEWPGSPEVRAASGWLSDTLADLETRGLLQWDREEATFDLHPVVRGYAVARLDEASRATSGQRVADHFTARAEPDYEKVTSLAEMADRIQVARALILAGKPQAAWTVLHGDMYRALYRLERHHEMLALLRPLFPNGWTAPPVGVTNPGLAATEVAGSLKAINRRVEADAQDLFSIQYDVADGISENLAVVVRNHAITLGSNNDLVRRDRALALSRAIAAAKADQQVMWCDLFLVSYLNDRGNLTAARRLWSEMTARPAWQSREGHLEAQSLFHEAWLLFHEGGLTEAHLRAALARTRALGRRTDERHLWHLLGIWHQAGGRHELAIAAFEEAIHMARDVGLSDPEADAQRGLSLARIGRRAEAEAAALSAERDPPHVPLAKLWLELGQRDKARDHALRGYKWAWADGPPYYHHWNLERCRAVLRALGEPEPVLPPFDPAKIEPLPYEADINRLLEEHAKQNPS